MKKRILTLACLSLLATGCSNNSDLASTAPQPQSTVITIVQTPSAAPTSAAAQAPSQESTTSAPTQQAPQQVQASAQPVAAQPAPTQPAAEPVQAEPSVAPIHNVAIGDHSLQAFSGTTLKGNDIYFVIFPSEEQISINSIAKGQNLSGSWGSICSNMATHDQLRETAIQTYTPGGQMTLWASYDYAFHFSGKTDQQLESLKAKILDVSNQYSNGYASCKPFTTGSSSAATSSFSAAEVGQYNIDVPTSGIAPLNKL